MSLSNHVTAGNLAPELFRAMTMRLRKLIGTVALFVLVIVWALIAMGLAQVPAIRDNTYLSVAYYVIAGLGWVAPAMPLVSWMGAPRSKP
jgi:multidrug transporter EmrE-like cation transporter